MLMECLVTAWEPFHLPWVWGSPVSTSGWTQPSMYDRCLLSWQARRAVSSWGSCWLPRVCQCRELRTNIKIMPVCPPCASQLKPCQRMRMLGKCHVPVSNGFDLVRASLSWCQIRRWWCSWLLKGQGQNVVAGFHSLGIAIAAKREFKEICIIFMCPWKKIADEAVTERAAEPVAYTWQFIQALIMISCAPKEARSRAALDHLHDPGETISVLTLPNNRDKNPETSLVQLLDKYPGGAKCAEWLWALVDAGQPAKTWLSECAIIPFGAGGEGTLQCCVLTCCHPCHLDLLLAFTTIALEDQENFQ